MDIRIGNDICLNVHVDNLDSYSDSEVASINCMLIRIGECSSGEVCEKSFPQFCHPSHYSTHSCGIPCYNAVPSNVTAHYIHEFHNECVEYRLSGTPDVNHNRIKVMFKGKEQKHTGVFKLILNIVLKEEDWGETGEHEYTIDYGYVFTLTQCKNASSGSIVLNVNPTETIHGITNKEISDVTYIADTTDLTLGRFPYNVGVVTFTVTGKKVSTTHDNETIETVVSKKYVIEVEQNDSEQEVEKSGTVEWFDNISIHYTFIVDAKPDDEGFLYAGCVQSTYDEDEDVYYADSYDSWDYESTFVKHQPVSGEYEIHFSEINYCPAFVSSKPISRFTQNGFPVQFELVNHSDGKYYYLYEMGQMENVNVKFGVEYGNN